MATATGTPETLEGWLDLARQEGREHGQGAYWFEGRDRDWDSLFVSLSFESGAPELVIPDSWSDNESNNRWEACSRFLTRAKEALNFVGAAEEQTVRNLLHSAIGPDATARFLVGAKAELNVIGEDEEESLRTAFEDAAVDAEDSGQIVQAIASVRRPMVLWVPIGDFDGDDIPSKRMSGCDTEHPRWGEFVAQVRALCTEPGQADELLKVIEDNAAYGGEPGMMVRIDGRDVVAWMESKDFAQLFVASAAVAIEVGVLDFWNGSGYFEEIKKPNAAAVDLKQTKAFRIVNNFIHGVFGVTTSSSIDVGGKRGTEWNANPCYRLNPTEGENVPMVVQKPTPKLSL